MKPPPASFSSPPPPRPHLPELTLPSPTPLPAITPTLTPLPPPRTAHLIHRVRHLSSGRNELLALALQEELQDTHTGKEIHSTGTGPVAAACIGCAGPSGGVAGYTVIHRRRYTAPVQGQLQQHALVALALQEELQDTHTGKEIHSTGTGPVATACIGCAGPSGGVA